jgi:predicted RNA-binding protein YlxR (DUF448 family)
MHTARHDTTAAAGHTPARTCIVSGAQCEPAALLRFVTGPDGTVVPDIAGKLPGRGAWIAVDRGLVRDAVRKKAFQRAFRRELTVPEDLADQVDRLLLKRALEALSMARKAGHVVTGFAKVDALVSSGDAAILVTAQDAGDDGATRLSRKYGAVCRSAARPPQIIDILTKAELGLAIGRPNVVHAALGPGRTSDGFMAAVARLARYRNGVAHTGLETAGANDDRSVTPHDVGPETEEV